MSKKEMLIQDIFNSTDSNYLIKADLQVELAAYINELILNNFDGLVTLLYRVDVNEGKLKKLLKENDKSDAGSLIATMIIERQLQKLKSRQENRQSGESGGDPDSW